MSNHRYSKWWWQDWRGDAALQRCSFAAKGLWMDMLCLLNDGQPYGHLRSDGIDLNAGDLADLIPRSSKKQIAKLLEELEAKRVFSRNEDGTIYSRRMVRDGNLSEKGAEAAERRWNKPNGSPNGPGNGSANGKPSDQPNGKPNTTIHRSESESPSPSDARPRWGAPGEASETNLVFLEPSKPEPPEPRRYATRGGGTFASTVNREPYGEVRSVSEQLAALQPPEPVQRPAFRPREPERTVEEQLAAIREEKSA